MEKSKIILFIVICFLISGFNYSYSKEIDLLTDFSILNLKIESSEIVEKITDSTFGSTLTPSEGYKLVVVTMKGIKVDQKLRWSPKVGQYAKL